MRIASDRRQRRWTWLARTALALSFATLGAPAVSAIDLQLDEDNALRNAAMHELDDGRPAHWTLESGRAEFEAVDIDSATGERDTALLVRVPAGGSVALSQTAEVTADIEHLFSIQARSQDGNARVVARIGRLTMSYNDRGRWQRVMGLVSASRNDTRTVRLELRALDDAPATVLLQDAQLRRLQRPDRVADRPRHGRTTLTDAGEPNAYIVYGREQQDIAEPAAQRIAAAIEDRIGVRLEVVSDGEITDADTPVLREPYRQAHLILLGRLATNRAIWPSYNRFLSAVDDHYPGGDGYVVRTAANVLDNGRNHLIVGASSDTGLERAVDAFIAQLDDAEADESQRTLTLDWLLDVEPEGEALAALRERDELWQEDPHHRLLPRVEPGYGTVRRWYENAMGYYWTGWDSYRQRTQEQLEAVVEDGAYTHHYIAEFFVRTYNMLDESDLYSDEQRRAVDELILTNFLDFLTEGRDLNWMTTFAPPYENVPISNRHQIAPWTADAMMADFLLDRLEWGEHLSDLLTFRRDEKARFFEHVLRHRWRPSGAATSGHFEEMAAAMLRYALHHEHYEFFERGHARRALPLDRIDHRTGMLVQPAGRIDHHLVLGILAHYYDDGRYGWLLERVPRVEHATGPFQGRYIAGVRRYHPGQTIEPVEPTDWAGVGVSPLSDHDRYMIGRLGSGLFHRPEFEPTTENAVDLLTFREGFRDEHDYVALTGLLGRDGLPGAFAAFSSGGEGWLGSGNVEGFAPASDRYFDQNGVSVIRTDRWLEDSTPFPAAARLEGLANLHQSGAGEMRAEPFMNTSWSRRVVWVRPGVYVVRDTITALEAGEYQIRVNWRPAGTPSWDGVAWTSTQNGQRFRLTPLGERFWIDQNIDAYLNDEVDALQFGHVTGATLSEGESVTATAVIEVAPADAAALEARLVNANHVWLKGGAPEGTNDADADMHVVFDGLDVADVRSDAATLVVGPRSLAMMQATNLRGGNGAEFEAGAPISLTVRADERAWLDAGDGEAQAIEPDALAEATAEHAQSIALSADAIAATWRRLQQWADQQPVQAAAPSADEVGDLPAPVDATDQWRVSWTYDGLKRPAPIRDTRRVGTDVVDLGRTVELDEIRAVRLHSGPWQPSPLPSAFQAAEPDPETGEMPPLDSDAWQPLPEPEWRPSVRTGNYGEAHPTDEGYQVVRPDGVRARYVRAERAHLWTYYARDEQRSREPVRLELHDVTGDGEHEIVAVNDISSDWPRERITEDGAFALLDAHGREMFSHDAEVNMQALKALDFLGDGTRKLALVRWDGRIRIFEPDGSLWRDLDLYQMHQDFQEREGRDDTRQPAGGFVTPYGLGLWDPDGSGQRRIVVPRYGRFSFLNADGEFEGVLNAVGYAKRGVLPEGIDFSGDGKQEQLALERFRVVHLDGDPEPYVPDPTGREFYPQMHQQSWLRQPDSPTNLAGAPVLRFEPIAWGEGDSPRYVLIVRETFLGIYDGRERDWAYTWVPLVGLRSVAVVRDEYQRLRVQAITHDGLRWQLDWEGELGDLAAFETHPLPDQINRIAEGGSGEGDDAPLWLAGRNGLYRLGAEGEAVRVAEDAFYDVRPVPTREGATEAEAVIATTANGAVTRIERIDY